MGGGRIAIMVDDMLDDVQSFVDASLILKERGAYKIYVLATHGILSADAPRLIEESPIDEVLLQTQFLMTCKNFSVTKLKLWIYRSCLQKLLEEFTIKNQCHIFSEM